MYRVLLALCFVGGIFLPASAQERGPATSDSSPPIASSTVDFSRAAQAIAPAVYYTGHPKGSTGTAVCINAKARLLATAAHVADTRLLAKDLYAVRSGTQFLDKEKSAYRVARVWYHKLTPRVNHENLVYLGLGPWENGKFNRVDPHVGFDVAILQLEGHERGSSLPAEIALPRKNSLGPLLGRSIGTLGFPGESLRNIWPVQYDHMDAVFEQGYVQREEQRNGLVLDSEKQRSLIRHSIPAWPGRSGSPLFTADGLLLGIESIVGEAKTTVTGHAPTFPKIEFRKSFSKAVHVDILWELIEDENGLRECFNLPVAVRTSPSRR